jgi:hypothetical protein
MKKMNGGEEMKTGLNGIWVLCTDFLYSLCDLFPDYFHFHPPHIPVIFAKEIIFLFFAEKGSMKNNFGKTMILTKKH